MSTRKPLPNACTGSVDCPVEGHVILRGGGHHRRQMGHRDLTPGQLATLAERRALVDTGEVSCPTCGAHGSAMQCSTATGRDHRARVLAERRAFDGSDR